MVVKDKEELNNVPLSEELVWVGYEAILKNEGFSKKQI